MRLAGSCALFAGVLTLFASGCGGDGRGDKDTAATGEAGSGESDEGDAGDGGTIRLDVEEGMEGGGDEAGGDEGCEGIDFLFVIDKSSSMTSKQENLVASFPGFLDAIEAKVEEIGVDSFHILVTHTDTIGIYNIHQNCIYDCDDGQGTCSIDDTHCGFTQEQGCLSKCRADMNESCDNGLTCKEMIPYCGECGCTLGAGRIDDMDRQPCGVEGGQAFIQSGQTDLDETFACIGEVGIQGGNERQIDAMLKAVSPELNANGGCNDSFLRNDSILVVTLITDEEDGEVEGPNVPWWNVGSSGTPQEWKEALVAAKGGDEDAVVMLGLIGDRDLEDPLCTCDAADPSCLVDGADPSPILREFVTSMPRNVVGSVCEPSYDEFFADAVDLIKDTCETFVPPVG